jgi:acyl-CoA thioester hydrolase
MTDVQDIRLRVRYAETDQMGVVYHANYLVWMEMGRVELCRSMGVRYRDMEAEDGVLLTVVEARCRYHSPARYDDEVIVSTKLVRSTSRLIEFGYEMQSADSGQKLATGGTTHMFCGREMRPCRLPEKYWNAFGVTAKMTDNMERQGATTFKGNPLTLVGPELKAGEKAPDFEVVDGALQPVTLAQTGNGVRIFSVLPSLDTPECDIQTKRINTDSCQMPNV